MIDAATLHVLEQFENNHFFNSTGVPRVTAGLR